MEKYLSILPRFIPKCINCGETNLNVEKDIFVIPAMKETPQGFAIDHTKGYPIIILICPKCALIQPIGKSFIDRQLTTE